MSTTSPAATTRFATDTARISDHNQDIKRKTLRAIIRQAGLTVDEFIDRL